MAKAILVTLAERFSKKTLIAHVPSKHATGVKKATYIRAHLTITEKSFSFTLKFKEALGSDNYFAHPYSSWERWLNENHKGMALDKVKYEEVLKIQDNLNIRPRKMLGYKTPNEVYDAMKLTA